MERMEGCIFTNDRYIIQLVRYLKNTEINRKKWDSCIEGAVFETLYPYSWYLDLVSSDWHALVKGDYEIIMPLTLRKKSGFRLLLQPVLAQQLGLFSATVPEEDDIREFISEISSRYRYIDICLNRENSALPEHPENRSRTNYELIVDSAPASFNTNTRRNIQKAAKHSFEFRKISMADYLDLKYLPGAEPGVGRDYMYTLFRGIEELGRGQAFGAFSNNQLQAASVLGYANTRVIYLNGCSGPGGKETRAMFFLMDQLIGHARKKAPIFDFEGSGIPGVARFFEGFGGEKTVYHRIIRKKFPFTFLKQ
jgi:hypothetical protein